MLNVERTFNVFRVAVMAREKQIFCSVSGNSLSSQGNTKFYLKVCEKSRNFILG